MEHAELEQADNDQEHTELFIALARRLLHEDREDEPERRGHLLRMLESLMPQAAPTARRKMVQHLTSLPAPPKDLASLLATDEARISTPLLRQVPFSPPELIQLISKTGPDHHIEIARRADLTLDVWLALARVTARHLQQPNKSAASPKSAEAKAPPSPQSNPNPEPLAPQAAAKPAPKPAPKLGPQPNPEAQHNLESAKNLEPQLNTTPIPARPKHLEPLVDQSDDSWQFETARDGRITRLSPNAVQAFGASMPALYGEFLTYALDLHAAAPTADDIARAMARHVPLQDLVFQTMPKNQPARRWRLRAQPRFSFPEGRFEGYIGTVRDLDRLTSPDAGVRHRSPVDRADDLLDRMARAADRLSQSTTSPELEDYAKTMRDCVKALKALPLGSAQSRPDRRAHHLD
ncbi:MULTISPECIES: PAS domain-containing protein [unclassified Iodidimonas]|uniref:PAS domain-containing protein n=1 Tax=unclassified Iodidimonas TaxID=2626145 RepID=UPI002482D7D2|nr:MULTISPECIES: PAS domain-containing protein [unclassified Iodidimonas]